MAAGGVATGHYKVVQGKELRAARITEVMEFIKFKGRGFRNIWEFLRHLFTSQSTKAIRDTQGDFYCKGGFEEILGIWLANEGNCGTAVVALPSAGRVANVAPWNYLDAAGEKG